jgi:hypothetical protein
MPKQRSAYKECRHILTTGRKCHNPALTGKPFCHHHSRQRNITGRNQRSTNSVELPPLEDHASILMAINQVVFALTHGRIEDKLAGRLLYAIQLAQNSINRIEEIDPAEMVTDYVDGRFGDIAAPAEPNAYLNSGSGNETGSEPSTGDDFAPLSAHAKTHSGHGDTCWEPTNADYPDHPEDELAPPEDQALQDPSCHPERSEGSAVAFHASGSADKPSTQPNPAPPKPDPAKAGPWDHPLLDHIVHQLQSGLSEREVAAQLARDLRSGAVPALHNPAP